MCVVLEVEQARRKRQEDDAAEIKKARAARRQAGLIPVPVAMPHGTNPNPSHSSVFIFQ